MKPLLTLAAMAIGITSLNAQTNNVNKHFKKQPDQYQQIVQRILNNHRAHTANKTTALKQRVIAEAGFSVNGLMITADDSTHFEYGGSTTRGSRFNLNETFHNYYFPLNDLGLDPFNGGKTDVLANVVKYWDLSGTTPSLEEDIAMSFTAGDNVADYRYITTSTSNNFRYANDYDAQGRVIKAAILANGTPTWDSAAKRLITYNAQNQVLTDSMFQYDQGDWLPIQAITYNYTGSRLTSEEVKIYTGTSFVDYLATSIDYYPNNDIKTVIISVNQGAGIGLYEKDSFAYAPANDYQTLQQVWFYDSGIGAWVENQKSTFSVSAQNLPDTSRMYSWDAANNTWKMEAFTTSTFNSYNNPEMSNTYISDGAGGFEYAYLYKFYYETFNATGIKNVARHEDIRLYPNPATDMLNLSWKEADGKPVNIQVLNASGQLVRSESFAWKQQTEHVSLNGLTPGMYFLAVMDQGGATIFKQSIIKQ